ncbi:MAG: hypothetical protein HYX78_06605 [Armatimonadetes bacterium]|nr:hypothetical protein [Armatimonadota bacterium]
MKRYLCIPILVALLLAAPVWSAKRKAPTKPAPAKQQAAAYPLVMQAVGTFDDDKPGPVVSLFASPDEREPASFTISAKKALTGVSLKLAGDLVLGKNKILASQVTISAMEGDRLAQAGGFDLDPSSEPKRFWMAFDVPRRTPGGVYQGAVLAVSGGNVVGKLPVQLSVLSMRLLGSSKEYGIILPAADEMDDSAIQLLSDVKSLGFGLVSPSVAPEALGSAVRAIREAGFTPKIPYNHPEFTAECLAEASKQAGASGASRVYYSVAYEPTTSEQIQAANERIEMLRANRLKSFAVISDPAAFDQLSESLDVIDCHIDLPYIQGLLSGNERGMARQEWWYWDITNSARMNRLYAGLMLWKSGLNGAFPALPQAGPADSVVGTIRWEALREGVDDTRYLTTMMAALREVKDALKVGATKNSTFAQKTVDDAEAFLSESFSKPLDEIKDSDYQAIRKRLALFTIKLRQVLK